MAGGSSSACIEVRVRSDMNNKLTLAVVVGTVVVLITCGQARADMYVNAVDVNQWIHPLQPASWEHMYDGSVASPTSASLTIEAADVSANEAQVWLVDSYGHWHPLGFLDPNNSATVFDLNPNWLDAMPVWAQIVGADNYQVWIGTSTLTVSGAIPAPAAVILGLIGLGCLGFVSRPKGR